MLLLTSCEMWAHLITSTGFNLFVYIKDAKYHTSDRSEYTLGNSKELRKVLSYLLWLGYLAFQNLGY